MNIEFDTLVSLQFKHNYFTDGKLRKFSVNITEGTKIKLNNNGILFKPFNDGFKLLYDKNFAGQKRQREDVLDNMTILRFSLTLNDPDFFNYTQTPTKDISTHLFYFHNISNVEPRPFSEEILHPGEFVFDESLISASKFEEFTLTKPFGVLDVRLNYGLPQELNVCFREKETIWHYVIAGNHLLNLNNPAIIGENNNFAGPEKIILPDSREALSFRSTSPIALKQSYSNLFKLVENFSGLDSRYRVILKSLPVPDIKAISSVNIPGLDKKNSYSEIFIN